MEKGAGQGSGGRYECTAFVLDMLREIGGGRAVVGFERVTDGQMRAGDVVLFVRGAEAHVGILNETGQVLHSIGGRVTVSTVAAFAAEKIEVWRARFSGGN
jgi:cell wall-associated NlpC family hydrolase